MTDRLVPLSFKQLLHWVLTEYARSGSIFSIPSDCFYLPEQMPPFSTHLYGGHLMTPFGPAAGPHTQMAQNILCAWLTGSRFIELKTVQIMDTLDIPRPCIDMKAEGYNVEWSQELRLKQSATEYVHAWVMIHILRRLINLEHLPLGTIFNMSVGYNLEGITHPSMLDFLDHMKNAEEDIDRIRHYLRVHYPAFSDIDIPSQISNNVTVSTMHGCPPEEIQKIGEYLLSERGLHTIIKLNPTLLGQEAVRAILCEKLGYHDIDIPDAVFAADVTWEKAIELIHRLRETAEIRGLHFGVKLSNTLAMHNTRSHLPGSEVYMSGPALAPVTVNLFYRLRQSIGDDLPVSYSGGADGMNLHRIIGAGALPVTIASDLLKPGGYCRSVQYRETLEQAMLRDRCETLEEYRKNAPARLEQLARDVLVDPWYACSRFADGLPKVNEPLPMMDCIQAPCMATCPANQNPPAYIRHIANNALDSAFLSILKQNPLPGMTGYVCPHTCEHRCTRTMYDDAVAIRHLKRFVRDNVVPDSGAYSSLGPSVAVVGAGPAGLSAAAFLSEMGVRVTIFEASDKAGGVPALAPDFRIPEEIVQADVDRIRSRGVRIELNHPVVDPAALLKDGFDVAFFAPGFPEDMMLEIPGEAGSDVLGVMDFLDRVKRGDPFSGYHRPVIIGGGNTAMDAARTAHFLTGHPATVIYRRTRQEMPAWQEEIDGCIEEGNRLIELTSPLRIERSVDRRVTGIVCESNCLGAPDRGGRPRPVPIPDSEHVIAADLVIVAIGQLPSSRSCSVPGLVISSEGAIRVSMDTMATDIPGVYAGGDSVHGPASIIQAVADGHRASRAIAAELGIELTTQINLFSNASPDWKRVHFSRSHLMHRIEPQAIPPDQRTRFDVILSGYTRDQAQQEAARCLQCDRVCDRCVDVCPNRANIPITIVPRFAAIPILKTHFSVPILHGFEPLTLYQDRQIIHIDDLCNACGNCATFCTYSGEPFKTKPVFFLDRNAFEADTGDAWHLTAVEMLRRVNGRLFSMTQEDGWFVVEFDGIRMTINQEFQVGELSGISVLTDDVSLIPVAEMIVYWEALANHPVAMMG